MRLSEIQDMDVINLVTGIKIGNIIDVKVDNETGKIDSLIVERKRVYKFFSSGEEIEIKWNQINKIGEDVILVETIIK